MKVKVNEKCMQEAISLHLRWCARPFFSPLFERKKN